MTVAECFKSKYVSWLKNMRGFEWESIKYYAERNKRTIPEHMMMCLEITENDIRKEGWNSDFYAEIKALHKAKLLASNQHRQEHGHVTKFWLTAKGLKKMAQELGLK